MMSGICNVCGLPGGVYVGRLLKNNNVRFCQPIEEDMEK